MMDLFANSAAAAKTVSVNTGFINQPENKPSSDGEVGNFHSARSEVYDGRFTNNGWLQELPNPLTKITWDNVALVSPNTAGRLGINQGVDEEEYAGGSQGTTFINTKGGNLFSDLVTLNYQGADLDKPVPMWIQPGQPDDVITIYMGYGRTRSGQIGTGSVIMLSTFKTQMRCGQEQEKLLKPVLKRPLLQRKFTSIWKDAIFCASWNVERF